MWCFITGRPLNLPLILASQLRRRGGSRRPGSPILGTHLITVLANTYGLNLSPLPSIAHRLLTPAALKNSGIVHKVGRRWVVGPQPVADDDDDDEGGLAAAAPQPRPPRVRPPRGHPAPKVPPPQPPVDQLTAQFDRLYTRIGEVHSDLGHQMDVN